MESLPELRSFLNAEGKLVALPAKKRKKLPALYFLSTKFEPNRDYTESEVNDILGNYRFNCERKCDKIER